MRSSTAPQPSAARRRPSGQSLYLGDHAREALGAGIALLGDLLLRTLGPTAGGVLLSREGRGPEVVRSAGVLARRVIAGEERSDTVGMMMLRHGVWRVHESAGDGGATAAALIRSMTISGLRAVVAGTDPVAMRRGLVSALRAAVAALREQARPVASDPGYLSAALRTAAEDRELGVVLGDLFDKAGPEVAIDVEEYAGLHVGYRLLSGCRQRGQQLFPPVGSGAEVRELVEPYILATTSRLETPNDVVPLAERIISEAGGPLLIIAPGASSRVLATLHGYCEQGTLEVVLWKPSAVESLDELLDVAVVVGARPINEDCGDLLSRARVDDLGYAGRVRLQREWLELFDAGGDAGEIESRRRRLRRELEVTRDSDERARLLRRVGVASGRLAVLEVGASTDSERKDRVATARRAVQIVPAALAEGVVAGGGVSLLNCGAALDGLRTASEGEEAGVQMLREALSSPAEWLIRNAGGEPATVLNQARRGGPHQGYDVVGGEVRDMWTAGILDPCKVVRLALEVAVSTVSSLLSSEALVLVPKPELSMLP
jgi:chaperonin GroEL